MIMSIIGMNKARTAKPTNRIRATRMAGSTIMFRSAVCELLRASNISAAERKASANAFFFCPQSTRQVRLSRNRAA